MTLASDRWTRIAADIAEGIVQRLAQADGTQVSVTIEVEATAEAGFDEAVQSDVTENAATLKFNSSDFEA